MDDEKDNKFQPKVIIMAGTDLSYQDNRRFYIFDKEVVLFARKSENAHEIKQGIVINPIDDSMRDINLECYLIRNLVRYCINLTPGLVENEPPEWEQES